MSIPITTESGAGGFILPNDRVDLIVTLQISDNPKTYSAKIVLSNVRVLAVDQTVKQDRDQKVVLAKTATLELSPDQVKTVERALVSGAISLALRPLGESNPAVASLQHPTPATATPEDDSGTGVTIIRFGISNGKRD